MPRGRVVTVATAPLQHRRPQTHTNKFACLGLEQPWPSAPWHVLPSRPGLSAISQSAAPVQPPAGGSELVSQSTSATIHQRHHPAEQFIDAPSLLAGPLSNVVVQLSADVAAQHVSGTASAAGAVSAVSEIRLDC